MIFTPPLVNGGLRDGLTSISMKVKVEITNFADDIMNVQEGLGGHVKDGRCASSSNREISRNLLK